MTWKEFWKKSFGGFIVKNVLLALVIVALLIWGTFAFINSYTEHGVVEVVPELRGITVEEAQMILQQKGLYPQVIDSVYTRDKKLGTIIEQIPAPNSTMKRERPVYLIINSKQIRQVPIPDVSDYSSRQATAIINASGIEIESVQYVPSQYKDLVIDVMYRGVSVPPGTKISEGDAVVLIVGSGLGSEEAVIPNLRGLTLEVARQEIINAQFVLGATHYDEKTAKDADKPYIIYRQQPSGGKIVPSGTRIDIWLSTDESLLKKPDNYSNDLEEEFF